MNTARAVEARNELLAHVELGAIERDELIKSVAIETGLEHDRVDDILVELERNGEVYSVNGVVKRT